MPRSRYDDLDDADNDDDLEATADEYGTGDEYEDPTAACPYCGEEIYDDAEWCPYCDRYLSKENARRRSPPWWILAGVLICLAIVLTWVLVL